LSYNDLNHFDVLFDKIHLLKKFIKTKTMKNLFLLLLFIMLGTSINIAQDQVQDRDQDRLMMVDGDVLQIRDRDQIRLQEPMRVMEATGQ
jgi:hypothetical protein